MTYVKFEINRFDVLKIARNSNRPVMNGTPCTSKLISRLCSKILCQHWQHCRHRSKNHRNTLWQCCERIKVVFQFYCQHWKCYNLCYVHYDYGSQFWNTAKDVTNFIIISCCSWRDEATTASKMVSISNLKCVFALIACLLKLNAVGSMFLWQCTCSVGNQFLNTANKKSIPSFQFRVHWFSIATCFQL